MVSDAPARPRDFNALHLVGFAQPERHRKLALRAIAGTRLDHVPRLTAVGQLQSDFRADAVAVRRYALRLYAQQIILIAAVIAQQSRRPVVSGDEKIGVAVVVEIAVGRASRNCRVLHGSPQFRSHGFKAFLSEVAKQVRRLRVFDLGLHRAYVVRDVAVGRKDVREPVQIIIEKEAGERERQQRRLPYGRSRRFVDKQPRPFVVIKRHHLV